MGATFKFDALVFSVMYISVVVADDQCSKTSPEVHPCRSVPDVLDGVPRSILVVVNIRIRCEQLDADDTEVKVHSSCPSPSQSIIGSRYAPTIPLLGASIVYGAHNYYNSVISRIGIHVWHLPLCKLYKCFDLFLLNHHKTIANGVLIRDLCLLRENKIVDDDQDLTSTELTYMINFL